MFFMKRKLFTLLMAFLALASFQANAQRYLIWTADYGNGTTGTNRNIPGSGVLPATTNYAQVSNLAWPGKLTVEGTGTSATWKWTTGNPVNTDQKFNLNQGASIGANFTKFTLDADANTFLRLSYAGIEYDKFIIFRGGGTGQFLIDTPWPAKGVDHAGYLSVNTAPNTKDANLVIVLVNKGNGSLKLETISYLQNHLDDYAPFAFYAEVPKGRWATSQDFADSKYWEFNLDVAKVDIKDKNLVLGDKTFNTFAVTQVDWVALDKNNQSGENIFGNVNEQFNDGTARDYYYETKFEGIDNHPETGLQTGVTLPLTASPTDQKVIPLFILSSPENDCDVVSVSRLNDLGVQTHVDGGYGNKLELRPFGSYYWYDNATGQKTYKRVNTSINFASIARWDVTGNPTPILQEHRVATSLQKFAIWIDEDGNKTIYPAASYSWKYGNDKNLQPGNVLPNSVLIYNNPTVEPDGTADKGWGFRIDKWKNGTADTKPAQGEILTGPNMLQYTTDYANYFVDLKECNPTASIAGKFFFLDVAVDKDGLPTSPAFGKGAYQDNNYTDYVLSTDIDPATGVKHLIIIPKERVRKYSNQNTHISYNNLKKYKKIEGGELLEKYWANNPYDSVNMAAHWGIYSTGTNTYLLVNMLGDTLQYDIASSVTAIQGGYKPQSSLMAATGTTPNQYGYFSPEGGNVVGHWFGAWAPGTITTQRAWTASGVPGNSDRFILNLGDQMLVADGAWYQGDKHALTAADSIYYQRNVKLAPINRGNILPNLNNYEVSGSNECAGGLQLTKSEIYYVPTYSASYDEEREDGIINTTYNSDAAKNFVDREARVYQDSLTAYLLLHGEYAITEAQGVKNDLLLGYREVESGAKAAVFRNDGDYNIEFIPLVTSGRTEAIRRIINRTDGNVTITEKEYADIDTLYGETYKWFIVKTKDQATNNDLYLKFDTINPQASNNRLKVGFVFEETDIANATPVRLYQPLVGDKLQGNFIFQFQLPVAAYYNTGNDAVVLNLWPDIEGNNLSTIISGVGNRLFGQLSTQSDYIHGTIDRAQSTRFTYDFKKSTPHQCDCPEQFIAPDWMVKEKLLGLPVENQIWDLSAGTGFGFNTGSGKEADEAIVKSGITEVKHIYVDSIRRTFVSGSWVGRYRYQYNTSPVATATRNVDDFLFDRDVPLYYVQNEKGEYLTVGESTYQFDSRSTAIDVTGVNLVWKQDLYPTDSDPKKNKRALQLFAISGSQVGPNADGWYAEKCTYVYLPLASYKVDYKTGTVKLDEIFYNVKLGKGSTNVCSTTIPFNDVTEAFRVSQYSPISGNQKNLIVANASGSGLTSVVPVELKWKKLAYDVIGCDYQLVKDITVPGREFFYAAGGDDYDSICVANSNTLLAHWRIIPGEDDEQLHTFVPEGVNGYGSSIIGDNKQLKGSYYVKVDPDNRNIVRIFDFSNYNSIGNYDIVEKKFEITCVEHTLPFANLEEDPWRYALPAQLAILEAPFVDRNLTDDAGIGSPLINGNSYQVYLNRIDNDINQATYVSVYKTNVRQLGEGGHIIPYYAFALNKNGKEYFLNVYSNGANDSVYWTEITATQKATIIDDYREGFPNAGSFELKRFKFCLPYQLKADGTLEDEVEYGEPGSKVKYRQVYLQTLDTERYDIPYLVVAGSATRYVTAKKLSDAISVGSTCGFNSYVNSLAWNIYTVDYAQINRSQVTSWIFGGEKGSDHEWVPLYDPATDTHGEQNTDGLLTNFKLGNGGYAFVSESNESPVNYGVLLGKTMLHFEYEGTEQIGTLWKVPIYYYRIQVSDKWFTDSDGKAGDYIYPWNASNYQLAYFDDTKITNNVTGKKYDKKYVQTFGLRYYTETGGVGDYKSADQTFVVVSNADFEDPNPSEYRYLAEVNGHLVFVKDIKNALLFQFGRDIDGSYTGIEVAGQAGVVGVQGGVRLLNQTGKVDIYSIDGNLVKSVEVSGADQTIAVPRGVVIVKIAGTVTKVVVK
jgi:hypothetical protein